MVVVVGQVMVVVVQEVVVFWMVNAHRVVLMYLVESLLLRGNWVLTESLLVKESLVVKGLQERRAWAEVVG